MLSKFRHIRQEIGFRGKILTLVTFGILLTAAMITFFSVVASMNRYQDDTIGRGTRLAKDLANKSILSLIYDSKESIEFEISSFMEYEDIVHVCLFRPDGSVFHEVGIGDGHVDLDISKPVESVLRGEKIWRFVSPVIVGKNTVEPPHTDTFYEHSDDVPVEVVGYASLSIDTAPMRKFLLNLLLANCALGLSVAILTSLFVAYVTNRLFKPLYTLSDAMKDSKTCVDTKGPKEISHIANTYNEMMAEILDRGRKLETHRKMLETEVELRTKDLVDARDLALDASRSKSQFVANTSHELRTPLQSVIGYTSLVKESLLLKGLSEDASYLEFVETDANKLLSLINAILDLAKVESGNIELKLKDVPVASILNEAATTIQPMINFNKNTLVVEDNTDPEASFRLDRSRIVQILTNLLSNAAKFTEEGEVILSASVQDGYLQFKVHDNGIGIPEADQRSIFEAFKQVDGSMTRKFEGTGLGLAITKQFCLLMQGRIDVESVPGEGSTFTVLLPIAESDLYSVK